MSIKDEIDMVKEELTSEEKFFQRSVMTERFLKKYKNVLIAGAVIIVVAIASSVTYNMNRESNILAANVALESLQVDPSNKEALANLATLSPALHDVFVYSKAIENRDVKTLESLKNTTVLPLADLTTYELAQSKGNLNELTEYALHQDSIYKDLAQVQGAIILINEGKAPKAHLKLQTIAESSPLFNVAKALLHYGVQ